MKRLAALVLWLFSASLGAQAGYIPQWTPSTEIWTTIDNSKRPGVVFANSYTGEGCASGKWCDLNLIPLGVAADAKSAFLSGILIITHGTTEQTCDMSVAFRAPGSTMTPDYYLGQTVETAVGGGQRSTMATWVPLVNGVLQWQWNRSTSGQWPSECSYGVNLSVQAWVR